MATTAYDNTVRVWRYDTVERVLPLSETADGHEAIVLSVAYSDDGRWLVSTSSDGTAIVWDVNADYRLSHVYRGAGHRLFDAAFSPDSATFATAGEDGSVRVWQRAGDRSSRALGEPSRQVSQVIWSGDRIISADAVRVRIWDPRGELLRTIDAPARKQANLLRALDADRAGRLLACGYWDSYRGGRGEVRLIDLADGGEAELLDGYEGGAVWDVSLSPDGSQLAIGSYDGDVTLWDVAERSLGQRLPADGGNVWSVAFGPRGEQLATASWDGHLRLWSVRGKRMRLQGDVPLYPTGGFLFDLAFSPDGRHLAAACGNGTVYVLDVEALER